MTQVNDSRGNGGAGSNNMSIEIDTLNGEASWERTERHLGLLNPGSLVCSVAQIGFAAMQASFSGDCDARQI